MRALTTLLVFIAVSGVASAEKPRMKVDLDPLPAPCGLGYVTYDWNFAFDLHGFTTTVCDDPSGGAVWEHGTTSYVPDAPGSVWGTVLEGDYPYDSGEGLMSPWFTVTSESSLLEIVHYFSTEPNYDGCNVSAGLGYPDLSLVHPTGGYNTGTISSNPSYYSYCVDGESGWTGESGGWMTDCFDLSAFMGQTIKIEFDFGSDGSSNYAGWYIAQVRIGALTGPVPENDTCEGALTYGYSLNRCTANSHTGTTSMANNAYNVPADPQCTGYTSVGKDAVYYMDLIEGDTALIYYRSYSCDGSLYVVTDCSDLSTCVAGSDSQGAGQQEGVVYDATATGRYFVMLDSYDDCGGPWWLYYDITCAPVKVCCDIESGSCYMATEAQCTSTGGVWHPEWDSCDPNPCPPAWAACCHATGECQILNEHDCGTAGGIWHSEWLSCDPNPCPIPAEPIVRAGGWIEPEPWHDWISDYEEGGVRVQAHIPDHVGDIDYVEFYYSTNGGADWEFIDDDFDGYEPPLDSIDPTVQMIGCGWSTFFEMPPTLPSGPIMFKSIAYPSVGDPIENETAHNYDSAPPSMGVSNLRDFVVVDRDALGIEIDSNGTEIDRILIYRERMQESFDKGIPGIDQHDHSTTHCAPTAAAQCLKYFEGQGDGTIGGGLDNTRLVGGLAAYMSTNQTVSGTLPSNWVGGMGEWIEDYGQGYTVRYYIHYECSTGNVEWTLDDWRRIRNELERCQDVLIGVFWDAGGGHAITLNSILHPNLPNGRVLVGFKDPWTGLSEAAELNSETGHLYNMTGAAGGGSGQIGVTMIVSPKESTVDDGGPGEPVYDGLPLGDPPYEIEIDIPEEGFWFIHVKIVNSSGHAHRIINIIERDDDIQDTPENGESGLLEYRLGRCVPNPFHMGTEVSYAVPAQVSVVLTIHDISGRKVKTLMDEQVEPGSHIVIWDGQDDEGRPVSGGIYYVTMKASEFEKTRKITLLR